ncbi:MAG: hypothetical protein KatS3mg102_2259 [Planctomycetota bacterium]|nr:MAG: hypothetical protein KatS3mg102_2259 [Planctomycetota bacterium]
MGRRGGGRRGLPRVPYDALVEEGSGGGRRPDGCGRGSAGGGRVAVEPHGAGAEGQGVRGCSWASACGAAWAAAGLLLLALAVSASAGGRAEQPPPPPERALNPYVLALLQSYPADGTHGYWWPKDGSYDGTTCDLVYQGEVVARGEPGRRTYCCGLTFEVWLRACEAWWRRHRPSAGHLRVGDLDAAGLRKLRAEWFCARGGRGGPVDALVPRGLGVRIERLQDARPGDFVQLWRADRSGHSVIFLGWERQGGEIAGIRYWSTQRATRGIGIHREYFAGPRAVRRDELYIARALLPAASAD